MKTAILKLTVTLSFLLLLFTVRASAQQDTTQHKKRWSVEGRADKMSDKLKHSLKLSRKQDEQIYAINEDIIRRADSIKHNSSLPQKERMQHLQSLSAERNQRFKAVLTVDQYKKFNDWNMQKKEHLEAKMDRKSNKGNKVLVDSTRVK